MVTMRSAASWLAGSSDPRGATTAAVWQAVSRSLAALHPRVPVVAPQRAYSGDLAAEVDALAEVCADAVVVGVSGGATLGLALLAAGVLLAEAVLHEPAAGSLVPGLLAPMAAAYASGGMAAFGAALYGRAWTEARRRARAHEPTTRSSGRGLVGSRV
jgi:hypothetical protein